jgi:hypothetical protein
MHLMPQFYQFIGQVGQVDPLAATIGIPAVTQ